MQFDLINNLSLWGAFLVTLALALLHFFAPHIRKLPFIPEKNTAAFGGGVAITYVFLHMIPSFAEHNQEVARIYQATFGESPLVELGAFLLSLIGFNLFYGLEKIARSSTENSKNNIYKLHIFTYCCYNIIIAYTMPLRFDEGISYVIAFVFAIGIHYLLVDHGLEKHFTKQFNNQGRFLLMICLFVGFGLAWTTQSEYAVASAFMVPFLAGSILMNIFKNEISFDPQCQYKWFITGCAFYATWMITLGYLS